MKKLFFILLFFTIAQAFAGAGWYVTIINKSNFPVTLTNFDGSCWYYDDFAVNNIVVPALSTNSYYTEEKNSSTGGDFCLTESHSLNFEIILPNNVVVPVKFYHEYDFFQGGTRIWYVSGKQIGKTSDSTVHMNLDILKDVCTSNRDAYFNCLFP